MVLEGSYRGACDTLLRIMTVLLFGSLIASAILVVYIDIQSEFTISIFIIDVSTIIVIDVKKGVLNFH